VVLVSAIALINDAFYRICFIKYSRICCQLDSVVKANSAWWMKKRLFLFHIAVNMTELAKCYGLSHIYVTGIRI
jgi:hypothetical protein